MQYVFSYLFFFSLNKFKKGLDLFSGDVQAMMLLSAILAITFAPIFYLTDYFVFNFKHLEFFDSLHQTSTKKLIGIAYALTMYFLSSFYYNRNKERIDQILMLLNASDYTTKYKCIKSTVIFYLFIFLLFAIGSHYLKQHYDHIHTDIE